MHLFRCVVKSTVTDSPLNTQTSCSKCRPFASMPFLTCVTRKLVTLRSTEALLMLLAPLRIRCCSSSLVFTLCGPRRWKNVTNHTVWGLEFIQRNNSNRLHMSAGSSCWMRWLWYGYTPSVCNVWQNLRVEISISGTNSRANYYVWVINVILYTYTWVRFATVADLKQLKCSGSLYQRRSQQYQKLPFIGSQ